MEQMQIAILGKLDQKLVNFEQVIECTVKKTIEENCGNKR
jgi:hypothetical protein